jgi:Flp pilus assembly pilin Flp
VAFLLGSSWSGAEPTGSTRISYDIRGREADTHRISAGAAPVVLTRNEEPPKGSLIRGIRRRPTRGDESRHGAKQPGGAATPRNTHGGSSGVTPQLTPLVNDSTPHRFLPARNRRREVKNVLKLFDFFASLRKREEGQTMAEYGVVLAVITIAVFGALALLSGNITNALTRVAGYIT